MNKKGCLLATAIVFGGGLVCVILNVLFFIHRLFHNDIAPIGFIVLLIWLFFAIELSESEKEEKGK